MSDYEPCPVQRCGGDARYAPPGRGHREGCTYLSPVTAPEERAAEVLVMAMAAHDPTADDRDAGGLVCSNPRHLAAALAPLFAEERRKGAEAGWNEAHVLMCKRGDFCSAHRPPYRERAATYTEDCRHEWVTADRAMCEAQEPPQTCARCGVALGATDVAKGRQIEENGGNA